jgi:hypothetical protein
MAITVNIPKPPLDRLELYDFWQQDRFSQAVTTSPILVGTAVSSGTNSTAVPTASLNGRYPFGVFLRSSTTANGGYRYSANSLANDFFGVISHKFQCAYQWVTSFTGRTVRVGYIDTTTSADCVDGAYFEILDNAVSCKTATNSVRTTTAMTTLLALNTHYVFDVEVNDSGTSALFTLYNGDTGVALETVTITTNIPLTSARAFSPGIIATEVSTTASDMGVLKYIGFGTINAFNRYR